MAKIKDLFIPEPGNCFIQADYSQIEFRVVVCEAKEPFLKEIFDDPSRDVFGELCEQVWGPSWTKHHRQIMKRVVHGTNYGMMPRTMTEQLNGDAKNFGVSERFTVKESASFQKKYLQPLPMVRRWQAKIKYTITKKDEDLVTAFGRRRRFHLHTKQNEHKIIHEGLAFIPQSTASDICLTALMELYYALPVGCFIRVAVHDSIMVECPVELQECVSSLMRKIMVASAEKYSTYTKFAVDIQSSTESWGKLK